MIRNIFPWAVLKQANNRLSAIAFFDKIKKRWTARMLLSADYRAAKESATNLARTQTKVPPMEGPVAVRILFYEPDRRRRDPSNLQKLIEDALTTVAYVDDSQIYDMHWTRMGISKELPRAVIEITPFTDRPEIE